MKQVTRLRRPIPGPPKIATSLFVSAAIQGLTVISGIFLARQLGPHGRGELAAVLLWPSILAVVGSLGIGEATTFHVARQSFRLRAVLATSISATAATSIALVSVGLLLIPLALDHYGNDVVHLGLIYLVYIPLSLTTLVFMSVLSGGERYGAVNGLRLLVFVLLSGGIAAAAVTGRLTVGSALLVYVAANAITAVAAAHLVFRSTPFSFAFDPTIGKALFAFGVRAHTSAVSSNLNQRLDQLLISVVLAPAKLGIYVIAVTMTSVVTLVGWSVAVITLPSIARADEQERPEAARRLVVLTLFLSLLVALPMTVLAPSLVTFFFGNAFHDAGAISRVLLFGAVFLGLNRVLEGILQGIGRPLDAGAAESIALVATVLGLAILLPPFGLIGAAVASVVAYLASAVWMTLRLSAALGVRPHSLLLPSRSTLRTLLRSSPAA